MRLVPPRELDPSTAPELEDQLSQIEPAEHVELDFAGVEFCDSSGLRVIVEAYKRFTRQGGSLCIVHPHRNVRRVFEVTGLTDLVRDDGFSPG
jgi:anti-sigma B factor antagonist